MLPYYRCRHGLFSCGDFRYLSTFVNVYFDYWQPYELTEREAALLALAKRVSEDSPDRSRKVGAIIVDKDFSIVTTGCNTLPLGVEHEDKYLERPAKYDWTEHAERNAIFEAAKTGQATGECTMILPWFPCLPCARGMVQAGITRVIATYPDVTDPTWGPGFEIGLELFKKAGIQFDVFVDAQPVPAARAEGDHAVSVVDPDRPSVAALVEEWNANVASERAAKPKRKAPGA
jgi:dCMP deaminase